MSKVSEKPVYTDWSHAKDGAPVSIIEKKYVKAKYGSFFDNDYGHEFSTDDSKFMNGTLKNKKVISEKGYGGVVEYTVELDSGEEKTFQTSPREYYFKVLQKN